MHLKSETVPQRARGRKQQTRWSKGGTTIFSITERKTSIQKHFSMSDEESHGAQANVIGYLFGSGKIILKS